MGDLRFSVHMVRMPPKPIGIVKEGLGYIEFEQLGYVAKLVDISKFVRPEEQFWKPSQIDGVYHIEKFDVRTGVKGRHVFPASPVPSGKHLFVGYGMFIACDEAGPKVSEGGVPVYIPPIPPAYDKEYTVCAAEFLISAEQTGVKAIAVKDKKERANPSGIEKRGWKDEYHIFFNLGKTSTDKVRMENMHTAIEAYFKAKSDYEEVYESFLRWEDGSAESELLKKHKEINEKAQKKAAPGGNKA
jgi:hypothetical protein